MGVDADPQDLTDISFDIHANLGSTRYRLVRNTAPGQIHVLVRREQRTGQVTKIFIPEALLVAYAKIWLREKVVPTLLSKL